MLPQRMSRTDPAYTTRVAKLAYKYWEQRGCPLGSPEQDWYQAEQELEQEWQPYGVLRFDGQT